MSNTAKFWVGAVLALPTLVLGALAIGGAGALVDAVTSSSDLEDVASIVVGLALLVGFFAALMWERTMWFALGILAGVAVLLILAAGACVVLLAAFASSYG